MRCIFVLAGCRGRNWLLPILKWRNRPAPVGMRDGHGIRHFCDPCHRRERARSSRRARVNLFTMGAADAKSISLVFRLRHEYRGARSWASRPRKGVFPRGVGSDVVDSRGPCALVQSKISSKDPPVIAPSAIAMAHASAPRFNNSGPMPANPDDASERTNKPR
jgi:hypothetical protein